MIKSPTLNLERSRAVLIGTARYKHLSPVPAAGNSLTRMQRLLTGPLCGWPPEQVTVLRDEREPGSLPDSLIEIYAQASNVALFYYVGHGQLDDEDHLCLGLVDSQLIAERRATTSLTFDAVRKALRRSPARVKIVILDCCFAGQAIQGYPTLAGEQVDIAALAGGTGSGSYTLTATGAYNAAWFESGDDAATPQTYFTRQFVDIVESGLPNEPSGLSLDVIFNRLRSDLGDAGKPSPRRVVRDFPDTFVFARNAALSSHGTIDRLATRPGRATDVPTTTHDAAPATREGRSRGSSSGDTGPVGRPALDIVYPTDTPHTHGLPQRILQRLRSHGSRQSRQRATDVIAHRPDIVTANHSEQRSIMLPRSNRRSALSAYGIETNGSVGDPGSSGPVAARRGRKATFALTGLTPARHRWSIGAGLAGLAALAALVPLSVGGIGRAHAFTFRSGYLVLSTTEQWHRDPRTALPGLSLTSPVAISSEHTQVRAGMISDPDRVAAELPALLRSAYGAPLRSGIVTLPLGQARRYIWPGSRKRPPLLLVIIATRAGELAVACTAQSPESAFANAGACMRVIDDARVVDTTVEYPGPSPLISAQITHALAARASLESTSRAARDAGPKQIAIADERSAAALDAVGHSTRYGPDISALIRALKVEAMLSARLATAAYQGQHQLYATLLRRYPSIDAQITLTTHALVALGLTLPHLVAVSLPLVPPSSKNGARPSSTRNHIGIATKSAEPAPTSLSVTSKRSAPSSHTSRPAGEEEFTTEAK